MRRRSIHREPKARAAGWAALSSLVVKVSPAIAAAVFQWHQQDREEECQGNPDRSNQGMYEQAKEPQDDEARQHKSCFPIGFNAWNFLLGISPVYLMTA